MDTMKFINEKCQVFTPGNYVEELLNSVGYVENLFEKKILENSCGDGKILTSIADKYIQDCRAHGLTDDQIRDGLSENICGIEIDPVYYNKCIQNLDNLAEKQKIGKVKWNVINGDYLKWECKETFQFVVGNPPYITYQELGEEDRAFVRQNFEMCEKGKFDYCYAFIEKSVKCLGENGKMAYLIPSSIFKTVFGEKLRGFIKPYLQEIHDYTQDRMFNDALVKSAILVLNKGIRSDIFLYYDVANKEKIYIPIKQLSGKWFFTKSNMAGTRRFGDYFQVSHAVATLLNEAFVIKEEEYEELDNFYENRGKLIEKAVVRDTATPRSLRYKKVEKIIFPYDYVDDKLVRYTEIQFRELFPRAEEYLNGFRKQLDHRKSNKSSLWFEYGRSQALTGLNKRKLLISTVITERVSVYMLTQQCIPYAGMYIVSKTNNKEYQLDAAKDILESDAFMKYVQKVGIHISGSSLRITSKDIENFWF